MSSLLAQVRPVSLLRRALSSKPWYVVLYVTSHCNQRCNMCFLWRSLNTLKRSEEWSLEEIERMADRLPDLYQLTLTGGEPTLRQDLADIIEIFYRRAGVRRITIPTNGYYPDRIAALVDRVSVSCPDLILSINMSIDGIGETHDRIRGVPGSFARLQESYGAVRDRQRDNPRLFLATASVITVSNSHEVPALLEWVRDNMSIAAHGLMLARGEVRSPEGEAGTTDLFIENMLLLRRMARTDARVGEAIVDQLTQSRIDTLRQQRMADPCLAGKKLLIIDERANVLPCEILKVLASQGLTDAPELGDFSLGNLREWDFDLDGMLNSPRAGAIREFVGDNRCWCTFECAQINNFVLNPQAYFRTLARVVTGQPAVARGPIRSST
jgi:MoaA/NifB/PqqE/SkfB family radical SAM enzyme